MTIALSPELQLLLEQRSQQEQLEINLLIEKLLRPLLEGEPQTTFQRVVAVKRGLEDGNAGRVRPLHEVMRGLQVQIGIH